MLNNRGQSLVLFVLLLPIIVLILFMVVDIGKIVLLRGELDNINNIALEYGLDMIEEDGIEDKLEEIIYKNKSDIDNTLIKIENDKIYIEIEDTSGLIIFKDMEILRVKSSYVGYIDEGKKIIERNK